MIFSENCIGESDCFCPIVYQVYNRLMRISMLNEVFRPLDSICVCAGQIASQIFEKFRVYNEMLLDVDTTGSE